MPERSISTWHLHRALGDGVVKRNAVTRPILLWFWLFVMCVPAGAQERPRVVQTFPDSGDGLVDFADFLLFVQQYGLSRGDERYDVRYDLDRDGTIGFGDFLIFANAYGE